MNDQLKKDIAEWQRRADMVDGNDESDSLVDELFSEARTLLLRASMTL